MRLRSKLAVKAAKLSSNFIKMMNRGSGATLPGYVARMIDPTILSTMANMVREKNFVVMGTNGKTTTNAILYEALKAEGYKVIINRTGANMLNGIISAFVLATDKDCVLRADYACIEVDEIASVRVLPFIKPDYALLTNIARDQLDRFGEMEVTFQKIKTAFSSTPETTLIINSDDVFSSFLAKECGNPFVTYGINENVFKDGSFKEHVFCRFCSSDVDSKIQSNSSLDSVEVLKPVQLNFDFYHYGQLGIYHCPVCGFARANPDFLATNILRNNDTYSFEIDGMKIDSSAEATYNIYNTLCAVALSKTAGANTTQLKETIENFDYGNNRESTFRIDGAKVQLHLAKNPIGFQQKISLLLKDNKAKDIIFLINDTYQDGEDVSWLWDVDFSQLGEAKIEKLLCAGIRKYDVGLRLKYEEISCGFVEDLETCIKDLMATGSKNIYLIINYSALYPTNALLKKLEEPMD